MQISLGLPGRSGLEIRCCNSFLDCPSHRDSPLQRLGSWVQASLVLILGRAEETLEGIPYIPEELCVPSPGDNLFSPWEGRAGEKLGGGRHPAS